MTIERAMRRRFGATMGLALLTAFAAASSIAATAPPAPVGLSVTIDDGVAKVAPHSDVTYRTTLSNTGAEAVSATIVVSIPDYARYTKARDGTVEKLDASWTVTVAPGAKQTVVADVRIGTIPKGQYRVATLASIYLGEVSGAPLIRSADSDRIPGVKDPAVAGSASSVVKPASTINWGLPVLLAAIVLVLAALIVLALVLVLRSRRRPQRSLSARRQTVIPPPKMGPSER